MSTLNIPEAHGLIDTRSAWIDRSNLHMSKQIKTHMLGLIGPTLDN
ncbi:hypothetical protein ISN45_At05g025460 [Arabidopsis thaliana x Arabidopsis arenosa]|uniref:Uncharacterized protein n=2 Tax=Arabidopsis TaxID=3701 RepID=A0A8T2DG58_ARASU|nr:hypothetical protein ISN45_At05g025460 [Arabidopsis thaliana x Arabidopsis arenosa]KAG7610517.1 hypothetical protein ISN44_As05g025190 [Arabidopsis suecica]